MWLHSSGHWCAIRRLPFVPGIRTYKGHSPEQPVVGSRVSMCHMMSLHRPYAPLGTGCHMMSLHRPCPPGYQVSSSKHVLVGYNIVLLYGHTPQVVYFIEEQRLSAQQVTRGWKALFAHILALTALAGSCCDKHSQFDNLVATVNCLGTGSSCSLTVTPSRKFISCQHE